MSRASIPQACWSGTGDTYRGNVWFTDEANKSILGLNHNWHRFLNTGGCSDPFVDCVCVDSDTLLGIWLVVRSSIGGTSSLFSTGECISLQSGFLPICLCK